MNRVLPILFNTEMVRAILDGRKTETRRIIKKTQCMLAQKSDPTDIEKPKNKPFADMSTKEYIACTYIPPYRAGDILYVRETWSFLPCVECMDEEPSCNRNPVVYDDGDCESEGCFVYKASHPRPERVRWTPSIHMPKEAARIWLKVTDVRVEQINDMTLDDFLREGAVIRPEAFNDPDNAYMQAKDAFMDIWDSTIRKPELKSYGWDANPWVWATEFERCEKPGRKE